ncbi:MAG: DUF2179 domain-containing protein [Clostridiales bacterium]|nr:DUF2179 domain-containing protein [Clostridiales bacterium]
MDFLQSNSIWIYFFIFFGKILEVTVNTIRVLLITKGQRITGALIAILEVSIWLAVTGTVLTGFKDDLLKCVVFVIAFSVGNYLGSWFEDKLAFGLASIQVIIPESETDKELAGILREKDFAVTVLNGKGKDGNRELLIMHVKRKRIPEASEIIKNHLKNAVIVINESKIVYGGFLGKMSGKTR